MYLLMAIVLIMFCVAGSAFLLFVLLSLCREFMAGRAGKSHAHVAQVRRTSSRGEIVEMRTDPLMRRKSLKHGETVALGLVAGVVLTLPTYANCMRTPVTATRSFRT